MTKNISTILAVREGAAGGGGGSWEVRYLFHSFSRELQLRDFGIP